MQKGRKREGRTARKGRVQQGGRDGLAAPALPETLWGGDQSQGRAPCRLEGDALPSRSPSALGTHLAPWLWPLQATVAISWVEKALLSLRFLLGIWRDLWWSSPFWSSRRPPPLDILWTPLISESVG